MVLVVVGTAAVRGGWSPDPLAPEGDGAPPDAPTLPTPSTALPDDHRALPVLHLPSGPRLPEQLAALASAARAAGDRSCLVTADASLGPIATRAVRFARQAVRETSLSVTVLDASPLRLSVAAAALGRLAERVWLPPPVRPVALRQLVEQTRTVLLTCSVLRLRRPPPSLAQRLRVGGRHGCFVAGDGPGAVVRWLPEGGPLPAALRPATASGAVAVTLARGRRPPEVTPLLDRLEPTEVVEVDPDPSWWRHWSSPLGTEVVVRSADGLAEAAAVLDAVSESWTCSWCTARLYELRACPQCYADFRWATEATPASRHPDPRRPAAVPPAGAVGDRVRAAGEARP